MLARRCAVGRTISSDAITTQALPRLIANFGWKNIGVLHVNDDYANAYARGMRDNGAAAGVQVVVLPASGVRYTRPAISEWGSP